MRKVLIRFIFCFVAVPSTPFGKEPAFTKYSGSYVCWDESYDPSSIPPGFGQPVTPGIHYAPKIKIDEFNHFPFFNLRIEGQKITGELWGMEDYGKENKPGYYRTVVSNLEIKPDGRITFELGDRKLYSKPMGRKQKMGKLLGISKSKIHFSGKFEGQYLDDLYLQCIGANCFKGRRHFSKDYP